MKQQVTFESYQGQTYCLRLQKQAESGVDAITCNIYAGQDYPFFIGDEVESHYNLIDEDGEVVADFDSALMLAEINVFVLEGEKNIMPSEVMFDVLLSNIQLNQTEFRILSKFILNKLPQVIADFYNGVKSENAAEFVRMKTESVE